MVAAQPRVEAQLVLEPGGVAAKLTVLVLGAGPGLAAMEARSGAIQVDSLPVGTAADGGKVAVFLGGWISVWLQLADGLRGPFKGASTVGVSVAVGRLEEVLDVLVIVEDVISIIIIIIVIVASAVRVTVVMVFSIVLIIIIIIIFVVAAVVTTASSVVPSTVIAVFIFWVVTGVVVVVVVVVVTAATGKGRPRGG